MNTRTRRRCPHCNATPASLWAHLLDTGVAAELPDGACPVLFEARRPQPAAATS